MDSGVERIAELETRLKKCEEQLKRYEELFEIEDGKVFVNSTIAVRGNLVACGYIGPIGNPSWDGCISSSWYYDLEDVPKMNKEDYKQMSIDYDISQKQHDEKEKKKKEHDEKEKKKKELQKKSWGNFLKW